MNGSPIFYAKVFSLGLVEEEFFFCFLESFGLR
jgi:hypothetical protein